MVLLCVRSMMDIAEKKLNSALSLLPLQMLLSIILEATKKGPSAVTEDKEQDQQPSKSRYLPAIVSCVLLGYEVLRGVVGVMSV